MDAETIERSETGETTKMPRKSESIRITGLGLRLKSAREAMHLSEKEAAARLHLNASLITIMESENFENAPPAAFLRGYLKSYARLLNLPETELNTALKDLADSIPTNQKSSVPVLKQRPINRSDRYLRWATYVIVLLLVSLVSIWWSSHSRYTIADVPTKTTEQSTATNPILNPVPPVSVIQAPITVQPATPPITHSNTALTPPKPAPTATLTTAESAAKPTAATDDMTVDLPEPGLEADSE
jgi:cytoskeleton protein RodZ